MLEKLIDEFMIGYGCVSVATIRKRNPEFEQSLRETKTYEMINRMLNPENIVIDVITGNYRKRKQLLEIIDTFEHNTSFRSNPSGCIVIPSITDLGTSVAEVKENYSLLCQKDISILILDDEQLSTADYSGSYCKRPAEVLDAIDNMAAVPTRQGRKKKPLTITDEFKTLYWYFENYFVPEDIVYYKKNTLVGKITKVAFNQLCDQYEQSPEYEADEAEQEALYQISQKPKRHGKTPTEILEWCSAADDGKTAVICDQLGMTPTTFNRYVLKGTGRRATGKATFAYKRQDIVDAITPKE